MADRQVLALGLTLASLAFTGGHPAPAAELGRGTLEITGAQLTISPESQTVPFLTPTIVETHLQGVDASGGGFGAQGLAGLRVAADFTGPEIAGVLALETVPNEPFRIPALSVEGEYRLENIRLVQGDEILSFAEPRSAVVRATQILVTRVSSRPSTLE